VKLAIELDTFQELFIFLPRNMKIPELWMPIHNKTLWRSKSLFCTTIIFKTSPFLLPRQGQKGKGKAMRIMQNITEN